MDLENAGVRGTSGTEEELFDDAFEQASGDGTAGLGAESVSTVEKQDEHQEEIVNKEEKVVEKKPVEKEKPQDEETYQQRYKTLQGIHKHDKDTWEAEKALLTKQLGEKEALKKEAEDLSKIDEDDLTEAQKAKLKEYEQDFETVSEMEGLKRDRELRKLRKEVAEFKKEIMDQLKPTQELLKETKENNEIRSREDHFNAIRTAHPDFESFRDTGQIKEWIETKPKYMREALLKIYSGGSTEEVIEFLNDFKAENNIKPDTDSKVVDINVEKNKKKEALRPVVSRRGAVAQAGAVATDFDGAFDEAANK